MKTSIVVSIAAISAACVAGTVPATASAATIPPARNCFTLPAVVQDVESGRDLWTYVHSVSWCGDKLSITSTVPPTIEGSTADDTCVWRGVKSQRADLGAASWTTRSMGEFACTGQDGILRQVNPWVIVTAYPNGSNSTESGVAVSVIPAGAEGPARGVSAPS